MQIWIIFSTALPNSLYTFCWHKKLHKLSKLTIFITLIKRLTDPNVLLKAVFTSKSEWIPHWNKWGWSPVPGWFKIWAVSFNSIAIFHCLPKTVWESLLQNDKQGIIPNSHLNQSQNNQSSKLSTRIDVEELDMVSLHSTEE